jgi:uncharacterized protein YbjT (DUF2867 family)
MNKIMVTGALGNVGGYVAKHLIKLGADVVVADINVKALEAIYADQATAVYFDFTDEVTFTTALQDVDRVFIMRPPHLGDPKDIQPFINRLAQIADLQMVCFLSLIGIEKNPIPPHYKIEKYIEKAGLPFCHIRPSFFMQNISGIHAFEIKHFDKIVVPVKAALTSFIDAEDIGEITAKVLNQPQDHRNSAYSITGPEALDYTQVASILSDTLNRTITYTNPSPRFAKKYWIAIRGIEKKYATVMGLLYMMTRLGTAKEVTPTFETIMGKQPSSFKQFVEKNSERW